MIIILRGHTGSGKTTLRQILARQHGFYDIEVDALKEKDPNKPYKLAGLELEYALSKGFSRIVIEGAFNPQKRIDEFFNETELNPFSENLKIIRLKCSLTTAISRKSDLNMEIVEGQVNRDWVDIKGEYCIDTETKSKTEIMKEVLKLIS